MEETHFGRYVVCVITSDMIRHYRSFDTIVDAVEYRLAAEEDFNVLSTCVYEKNLTYERIL